MRSFVMTSLLVVGLSAAPLATAAAPASAPAPQVTPEVTIVGPAGQTLRLDAGDLEDFPRAIVRMDAHGQHHVFEGAQLLAVLARAGAPSGEALRGAALTDVVIVTARDGYQVVLSLAEIDPALHHGANVILADHDNGGEIGLDDGPFRLAVDGDERPARSARMVARIEVRQLGRAQRGRNRR